MLDTNTAPCHKVLASIPYQMLVSGQLLFTLNLTSRDSHRISSQHCIWDCDILALFYFVTTKARNADLQSRKVSTRPTVSWRPCMITTITKEIGLGFYKTFPWEIFGSLSVCFPCKAKRGWHGPGCQMLTAQGACSSRVLAHLLPRASCVLPLPGLLFILQNLVRASLLLCGEPDLPQQTWEFCLCLGLTNFQKPD